MNNLAPLITTIDRNVKAFDLMSVGSVYYIFAVQEELDGSTRLVLKMVDYINPDNI